MSNAVREARTGSVERPEYLHNSEPARESMPQDFRLDGIEEITEAVRREGGTPCIPLDQMQMREPLSKEPSTAREITGTQRRPNIQPTPQHGATDHSSDTSTQERSTSLTVDTGKRTSYRAPSPVNKQDQLATDQRLPSSSQRPVERHSWEPTAVNIQGSSDDSACASPHNINLDRAAELASEHAQGGDSVPTGATQHMHSYDDQQTVDQHMRAQTVEQRRSEKNGRGSQIYSRRLRPWHKPKSSRRYPSTRTKHDP